MARQLDSWADAGLVRLYYGQRERRHAPIVGVQIPALTDALLWMADLIGHYCGRNFHGCVEPKHGLALIDAFVAIDPVGLSLPSVETAAQAKYLLRVLRTPPGTARDRLAAILPALREQSS